MRPPLLGALAADPMQGVLPPLMRNTTSLSDAVAGDTLGVSYGSGGFLVFYLVGVSKVLQQLGVIKQGHVRTAGVSVGSLAMGNDFKDQGSHDYFIERGIEFVEHCRANRGCYGTLDKEYGRLMDDILKPDVHEAISGRACMVMTRGTTSNPRGEFTCDYATRGDVIEALLTSGFVPGWSARSPTRDYRGEPAFDGVFSQLQPCPPNVTFCLKIAALPPVPHLASVVSPSTPSAIVATARTAWAALRGWLGNRPLEALADAWRARLLATLDPATWARIVATNQVVAATIADIYPGKFGGSPLSPAQWFVHMLAPPDADGVRLMYRAGQDDAMKWAQSFGWPTESPAAAGHHGSDNAKPAAPAGAHFIAEM